ncbi:antitoxin [Malonomonas rubra]|uniref:antitoxin n=1 Tax=Malonomonas rubra TaxID=57040 RepID=UPI0026F1939C|nr:antitoxin [Malonomonas rubra]
MQLEKIYRDTIAKWGEDAQYDQAVEECAELIAALKHYRRGKIDKQAVIAELADVTLMLGQLSWMFGQKEVDDAVQNKLAKLDRLMNES